MKNVTKLMCICGGFAMAAGLSVVIFAMTNNELETRLVGMLLMSFGAMAVAVPLYVEARRLKAQLNPPTADSNRKGTQPCSTCGTRAATFWCTTHLTKHCADCVPRHHDPARCLYKPIVQVATARR